jgi:hypothetical protein
MAGEESRVVIERIGILKLPECTNRPVAGAVVRADHLVGQVLDPT